MLLHKEIYLLVIQKSHNFDVYSMVYTVVMVSENPNSILYLLPLKLKVVTVVVTVVVGVQGYSKMKMTVV
ncbi:Uncharacterised protein [Chlamydia trachomatis]|nr:Uncharacterised protein [Chlamydia trachomatis]